MNTRFVIVGEEDDDTLTAVVYKRPDDWEPPDDWERDGSMMFPSPKSDPICWTEGGIE